MKNYVDEILMNQVNMGHKFNPLVASITPNDTDFSLVNNIGVINTEMIVKMWSEIKELKKKAPAFVELSCKNCGAKIQQKYEDQIIKCPYCKSVYVIGTWRVNET